MRATRLRAAGLRRPTAPQLQRPATAVLFDFHATKLRLFEQFLWE